MEKYIAILHHKYQLADDFFLLAPERAIVGTIQETTGILETDTNSSFPYIEDKPSLQSKDCHFLYGIVEGLQDFTKDLKENMNFQLTKESTEEVSDYYFQLFEEEITIAQILEQENAIRMYSFELDEISDFLDDLCSANQKSPEMLKSDQLTFKKGIFRRREKSNRSI